MRVYLAAIHNLCSFIINAVFIHYVGIATNGALFVCTIHDRSDSRLSRQQ